jgi:predicted nucleotidyltransferase
MVNYYKLKLTLLQQEILNFLFSHSESVFNARDLARALKVSQPAISKALPFLSKSEFIRATKDKNSKRFSIGLNRDNPLVIGLKRAENLKLIYESGLAEFLKESFPGCLVILFGSFSRGEDIGRSDIDIAVIGTKGKNIELSKFNKLLEKEIIVNFYTSFGEIHKNLKENILNGIVISGGVEL